MQTFFSQNPNFIGYILTLFALTLSGLALYKIKNLNSLKKKFFQGSDGADLENILRVLDSNLQDLQNQQLYLEQKLLDLTEDGSYAIKKIGLVKFNPYENSGGNLSFCIALLNGKNSGLILTSMHGREHNRIYTKKIIGGKSEITLTEEEIKAVNLAQGQKDFNP